MIQVAQGVMEVICRIVEIMSQCHPVYFQSAAVKRPASTPDDDSSSSDLEEDTKPKPTANKNTAASRTKQKVKGQTKAAAAKRQVC